MMQQEQDTFLLERRELTQYRFQEILAQSKLPEPFGTYFCQTIQLLLGNTTRDLSFPYEDETAACERLGVLYGTQLSLLYAKLLDEKTQGNLTSLETKVIFSELLLEIYCLFENNLVSEHQIHEIIYWFFSDYSELFVKEDLQQLIRGREPSLENRIWGLYADKKYKERYLQAFYQEIEEYPYDTLEMIPIFIPSLPYKMTDRKKTLLLKMKKERMEILVNSMKIIFKNIGY